MPALCTEEEGDAEAWYKKALKIAALTNHFLPTGLLSVHQYSEGARSFCIHFFLFALYDKQTLAKYRCSISSDK